jgi:peroxiredoxin Q/BCP
MIEDALALSTAYRGYSSALANPCISDRLTACVMNRITLSDVVVHFMDPKISLKAGDTAPDFSAQTNGGGNIKLSDFRGKHVVLYFYPKDDTPGCTTEACSFRDNLADLQKRGVVVFGASTDSVKSHDKFAGKFKLNFPLIADESKEIAKSYDAWGEKSFMGRKYMGTHRITFLIGPDGTIKKIWPKVKPAEHVKEILKEL